MVQCPGQDTRYWQYDDIFEIECPFCLTKIEFFKDDVFRVCPKCQQKIPNPKLNKGCAEHCPYAGKCFAQNQTENQTTKKV